MALAVIVLAAGRGTRMRSAKPKVLHEVAGRSLLAWVQATAQALEPNQLITVLGPDFGLERQGQLDGSVVIQEERRGTGHAAQQALPLLSGFEGWVLILYGDTVLVQPETLNAMLADAAQAEADLAVAGFNPDDPAQYGRLLVEAGRLTRIVEFEDASDEERTLGLCNGGLMALRAPEALDLLGVLDGENAAGELYLTDLVDLMHRRGGRCLVHSCPENEVKGVNTRSELAEVEAIMQDRLRERALRSGVTMQDPGSVFLSYDTQIGQDTVLEPQQIFRPGVTLGTNVTVRANCHFEGAQVGDGAQVGPFARLRPGTVLGEGVRIGNFVEIKQATIKEAAKVNHLSYVGDAEVGPRANMGAGAITVNYDGVRKHRTEIGAEAFVGSNASLIAPIKVGAGALVGAGSTVSEDIEDQALALGRADQRTVPGAAARFRSRRSKPEA